MYRRDYRNQLSFEDSFLPFGHNLWVMLSDLNLCVTHEDDCIAYSNKLSSTIKALEHGTGCFDHQSQSAAHG
jgi:hypothetical protein